MNVKFIKCAKSKLSSVPVVDGQVIVLTDAADVYYDMSGGRSRCVSNGNSSNAGIVKLNDAYKSSGGAASSSVGASSKAVADCYSALSSSISTVSKRFAVHSSDSHSTSYTTGTFSDGMYLMCILDSDSMSSRNNPSIALVYFSGTSGWINLIKSSNTIISSVTHVYSSGHRLKVTVSSAKYISVYTVNLSE